MPSSIKILMSYYAVVCFLFYLVCVLGATSSFSRAASVSKKNESTALITTKRVSKNSTIFVRTRSEFGGTVTQETCRCVPFYSCDAENYNQSDDNRNVCPSTNVCCRVETPLDLDFDGTEVPDVNSNSQDASTQQVKCGERRGSSSIDIRVQAPEDVSLTEFSEFPWMASIWGSSDNEDSEFICGASLLSANMVLTAAHCLKKKDNVTLTIRVGDYDIKSQTPEELAPHQEKAVSSVVTHPNYDSRSLVNDLAVITTEGSFELASHVTPVCTSFFGSEFADSKAYNLNECLATGWGKSSATSPEKLSVTLKKVDLKVVPFNECQEKLRTTRLTQNFNLDRSFLCAGGVEGFDTCKGDGGGPLVCPLISDRHRYVQIGVTSWGVGCGNDIPGVYASLEANNDWLSSVLK